jgi:S-(hydroxymethyl)glutathione dehydrogenase/alcohol dehydrogenase
MGRREASVKAAIFYKPHEPLAIEDIEIDRPLAGEVRVRTVASGVCGSDVHIADGFLPGATGPMVLGHEAAGRVEEIGPGVEYVRPGDPVVICPSVWCGECEMCLRGHPYLCEQRPARRAGQPPRLSQGGHPVAQFTGVSSFAESMLVAERNLLKVDRELPLQSLALIGCGVLTGLGAVLRTARIEAGASVAVFGAGGVGLAAIQGAHLAGAAQIVAVDLAAPKLELAQQLGATHAVDASREDPVAAIRRIAPRGVDYAFEAIGNKRTAEQAFASIRDAGTAVLIGFFPADARLELPAADFITEKRLIGSRMGSNRFRLDMPAYIELYRQGRLKLDELVTRTAPLDDVNEAFRAVRAGEVTRTVLTFH